MIGNTSVCVNVRERMKTREETRDVVLRESQDFEATYIYDCRFSISLRPSRVMLLLLLSLILPIMHFPFFFFHKYFYFSIIRINKL